MVLSRGTQDFVFSIQGDTRDLDRNIDRANRRTQGLSRSFGAAAKAAAGIGLATAALGGAAGVGIVRLASTASDLAESVNALNVVFGDATQRVQEFGVENQNVLKLTRTEYNQAATTIGAILQTYGFSNEEAAAQTEVLVSRAADLASVFNTDVDEALQAIISGLNMQSEPLLRFGANLTEAGVNASLVAEGLEEIGQNSTAQEKAIARINALLVQTAKVEGDAANTSSELAAQQRLLRVQLSELGVEIGEIFLPAMLDGLTALNEFLPRLTNFVNENTPVAQEFIENAINGIVAVARGAVQVFQIASSALGDFIDVIRVAIEIFQDVVINANSFIESLHRIRSTIVEAERGTALLPAITFLIDALTELRAIYGDVVGDADTFTESLHRLRSTLVESGLPGGGLITALIEMDDTIENLRRTLADAREGVRTFAQQSIQQLRQLRDAVADIMLPSLMFPGAPQLPMIQAPRVGAPRIPDIQAPNLPTIPSLPEVRLPVIVDLEFPGFPEISGPTSRGGELAGAIGPGLILGRLFGAPGAIAAFFLPQAVKDAAGRIGTEFVLAFLEKTPEDFKQGITDSFDEVFGDEGFLEGIAETIGEGLGTVFAGALENQNFDDTVDSFRRFVDEVRRLEMVLADINAPQGFSGGLGGQGTALGVTGLDLIGALIGSAATGVVGAVQRLSGIAGGLFDIADAIIRIGEGLFPAETRGIFARGMVGAFEALTAVLTFIVREGVLLAILGPLRNLPLLLRGAGNAAQFMADQFENHFQRMANAVVGALNAIIRAWNRLEIPGISISIPNPLGEGDIEFNVGPFSLPNIPRIPQYRISSGATTDPLTGFTAFREGGIVLGPTLGLLGEAGPEAVIPLDRTDGIGTTIIINNPVGNDVEELVVRALRRENKSVGGRALQGLI